MAARLSRLHRAGATRAEKRVERCVFSYAHGDGISRDLTPAARGVGPHHSPGDVWHGVSRSFGVTTAWTGVFTRVDVPTVMEFRTTQSRFPMTTTDTLDEVDGGTRYTCRVTGDPLLGGPVGRLLDAVLSWVGQRILAKHQAQLPGHIDAAVRDER